MGPLPIVALAGGAVVVASKDKAAKALPTKVPPNKELTTQERMAASLQGVVGGTIVGGLTGIGIGATIGGLGGPVGSLVGGYYGGIAGVMVGQTVGGGAGFFAGKSPFGKK